MKPIDDADTIRNTEFLHKAELDIVPLASCWPGDEAGALSEEGYDASTGPNMDRASATQISLTGNGRERRTGNLNCALYDVQGVSMSHPIDEDAYLVRRTSLGLAVLRLEDDVVLEICDKTN